ncbi:MAG: hypothetical protein BHW52_06435 [Ruminococcus sp. 37_24]|nr:MAG: hypothetical protein BHW52_06435 [Ruminococcus sp. 37_24]
MVWVLIQSLQQLSVEGINGYTGTTSSVNWGIDKKDLADCDITAAKNSKGSVSVVVMNGNVKVPTEKYVVTENADGTVTLLALEALGKRKKFFDLLDFKIVLGNPIKKECPSSVLLKNQEHL